MTTFQENLRGITAILICYLLFLLNDMFVKLATAVLPLGEILAIRGAFAVVLLLPFMLKRGGAWRIADLLRWPVVARALAEMTSAIFYISALIHLPIANANAIMQLTPVAVTASGAIFFGERVGWRRWTAIAVALLGVFIIVRPGFAGFNVFSLLVLAAMLVVVARDMATRAMDRGLPALPVSLATALVVTVSGPIVSLVLRESWLAPPTYTLTYLFFAAIFLIGGYLSSVVFMRHGDIAVVAPFRYSGIVWATLIGFIVWHELPDWPTVAGTLVVVATGVYTFQRERRLAMAKAAA